MTSHKQKLIEELKERAFRRAFVEGHAKDGISTQIRLMRKAAGWDQRELASKAFGDPSLQSMVSRYENPDYGKYSLSTLLEIAAAFDVALVVRFSPFSQLIDWDLELADSTLVPKNFSQELQEGFLGEKERVVAFNQTAPIPVVEKSVASDDMLLNLVGSYSTTVRVEPAPDILMSNYIVYLDKKVTKYGEITRAKTSTTTTGTKRTIRDSTEHYLHKRSSF